MSSPNPVYIKDPDSVKEYTFLWASFLAVGANVDTSIWYVPAGLTLGTTGIVSNNKTYAFLAGGTVGQDYLVTNRITTAGRTEEATLLLQVRQSSGAGTVALISLLEFKALISPALITGLSGDGYDVFWLNMIEAVSSQAEKICNRKFRAANYIERVSFGSDGNILTYQYPIIQVFSLHQGLDNALDITNAAVNAVRASVRVETNRALSLQVWGGASNGTLTIDLTASDADSLSELRAKILSLGSGWSAELSSGRSGYELSEDLIETVALQALPNSGHSKSLLMLGEPVDVNYELDRSSGRILYHEDSFFSDDWEYSNRVDEHSRGVSTAWIKFRAGFETIEPALKLVLAQQVRRRALMESYNPFLSGEKIGAYSYETASIAGVQSAEGTIGTSIEQDFERALRPWRRPSV